MLVAVKLPRNEMVAPAVESEIVTDVALTVLLKVTPEVLSVIVNAPAVPDPSAPIVARPPASRMVNPPAKLAMEVRPIVAPAVEPESNVRLFPPLVTAPTFNTPTAELPVSSIVAAVRVTAPRSIGVSVVLIVPAKLTLDGLVTLPVVANPPTKVSSSRESSPITKAP